MNRGPRRVGSATPLHTGAGRFAPSARLRGGLRTHTTRWKLWRNLAVGLFCLAALVGVAGFAFAKLDPAGFLHFSNRFLDDSDAPAKADLLFVLGGDFSRRAPFAAELYRDGLAPRILLAREPSSSSASNFTDTTISILQANGVPKDRIIDFAPTAGVTSTADEARALKLYVSAYRVKTLLVVTSAYHTRRARMALSRALRGSGTHLIVVATPETPQQTQDWLNTEPGKTRLELEWVKLFYYFFTFWG